MEKFTIIPNGINHNHKPVFVANWLSGGDLTPADNGEHFYYAGSGADDRILIKNIEWQNEKPDQDTVNQVMDKAITAIDHWISDRF